jgi:hypothetical protein
MKAGSLEAVQGFEAPQLDPVATQNAILAQLPTGTSDAELDKPVIGVPKFSDPGPGGVLMTDAEAAPMRQKFAALQERQILLRDGNIVANWIGAEYWTKTNSVWSKEQISDAGVALPKGAILDADLTQEQRAEIEARKETGRIASLAPAEREKEKNVRLKSLAREANLKAADAELLGETFDKQAWFQEQKTGIETKYA